MKSGSEPEAFSRSTRQHECSCDTVRGACRASYSGRRQEALGGVCGVPARWWGTLGLLSLPLSPMTHLSRRRRPPGLPWASRGLWGTLHPVLFRPILPCRRSSSRGICSEGVLPFAPMSCCASAPLSALPVLPGLGREVSDRRGVRVCGGLAGCSLPARPRVRCSVNDRIYLHSCYAIGPAWAPSASQWQG